MAWRRKVHTGAHVSARWAMTPEIFERLHSSAGDSDRPDPSAEESAGGSGDGAPPTGDNTLQP